MKHRPSTITVISWAFIALGAITFVAALLPLFGIGSSEGSAVLTSHGLVDLILVLVVRLLAVVCGVFMLYGYNWARWLLIAWMGFHVIISIGGSAFVIIVHSVIFIVVLYLLFRPDASEYFRNDGTTAL